MSQITLKKVLLTPDNKIIIVGNADNILGRYGIVTIIDANTDINTVLSGITDKPTFSLSRCLTGDFSNINEFVHDVSLVRLNKDNDADYLICLGSVYSSDDMSYSVRIRLFDKELNRLIEKSVPITNYNCEYIQIPTARRLTGGIGIIVKWHSNFGYSLAETIHFSNQELTGI